MYYTYRLYDIVTTHLRRDNLRLFITQKLGNKYKSPFFGCRLLLGQKSRNGSLLVKNCL